MSPVVPQRATPGILTPPQLHKQSWRPFTLVPCLRASRHQSLRMPVNSTASAQVDSLERLRQADGAGPAHAEALAEDAIVWASLNGLVRFPGITRPAALSCLKESFTYTLRATVPCIDPTNASKCMH